MSLANVICNAVKIAKANLGDLVVQAVLRRTTGKTYDTATGRYESTTVNRDLEVAPDKFTYTEMNAADFNQTDVKLTVFNPDNDIEISTDDQIMYPAVGGALYSVWKVLPEHVGGYKPVIAVVLRK